MNGTKAINKIKKKYLEIKCKKTKKIIMMINF